LVLLIADQGHNLLALVAVIGITQKPFGQGKSKKEGILILKKKLTDAQGLTLSPGHSLVFAFEKTCHHILQKRTLILALGFGLSKTQ
jgi:hypothetical protein